MLRPTRQSSSSILPNYGGSSGGSSSAPSSCSVGYGSSGHHSYVSSYGNGSYANSGYGNGAYGSGCDNYSPRRSSFSSPLTSKRRPSYSSNSDFLPSAFRNSTSWLALGLGFFILLSGYYQNKFQWLMQELDTDSIEQAVQKFRDISRDRLSRKRSSTEMDERYSILERLNAKLHKEKEDLRSSYEKKMMKEFTNRRQEEDRLIAREEAFKSQIKVLQEAASRNAQRSVADRFGQGPHYVEFTFVLPSDENETEHHFIVETAPLKLMPHAVQLFLEQVAHKLWDNSWFYINGPHVLQAGPMLEEDDTIEEDTFEEDRKRALKPFVDSGLDTLSYPEYSDLFRHEKWTLGFTGRPGGPDWYINKQNNTIMHGPGGQYHHDIEEQADPCFARVIEGMDLVEQIFKESTIEEGDDWEYFFWDPVYIVKANIIDKPHHIDAASDNTTQHQMKHHHVDFHKFPKIEHGKA